MFFHIFFFLRVDFIEFGLDFCQSRLFRRGRLRKRLKLFYLFLKVWRTVVNIAGCVVINKQRTSSIFLYKVKVASFCAFGFVLL